MKSLRWDMWFIYEVKILWVLNVEVTVKKLIFLPSVRDEFRHMWE